jgi:predicted hydrocarbon binding protein
MHGVVFVELEKYVSTEYGLRTWTQATEHAGVGGKIYMAFNEYPDAEINAIVMATASMVGHTVPELLEGFGEFIAPSLLKMYGHLLAPSWKALDVIENTEATVHTVVRSKNPGAHPPQLRTKRSSPNEVVLIYSSKRQMCSLAIGVGRGLGRYYKENLSIRQTRCMHRGDPHCEIIFQKLD